MIQVPTICELIVEDCRLLLEEIHRYKIVSLVFVKRSTNQDAHLLARAPGFSYYCLCEHFLIQYVYSFVEKNTFKGKLT